MGDRTKLGIGLLVAVFALAAPGGVAPAAFEPQEFEVDIAMEPDVDSGEPDCVREGDGMTCTMNMVYAVTGKDYKGTVSNASLKLSGTISQVCDMDMKNRMVTHFAYTNPSEQDVREFSGGGSMNCSWFMNFSEGSTLNGTIAGKMTMSKVEDSDPPMMRMEAEFAVNVLAGTGVFEGEVGSGTFNESDEFSLEGPEGQGPGGPPAQASRAFKSAADEDGAMKLKLGKGRARAAIIAPTTLKASDKRPLRVASARGATCRATATKAGRKIGLGTAKDSNRNGDAEFKGALARKLGKGTWRIASTCAYTSKGKRVTTAPAKKTVRVV